MRKNMWQATLTAVLRQENADRLRPTFSGGEKDHKEFQKGANNNQSIQRSALRAYSDVQLYLTFTDQQLKFGVFAYFYINFRPARPKNPNFDASQRLLQMAHAMDLARLGMSDWDGRDRRDGFRAGSGPRAKVWADSTISIDAGMMLGSPDVATSTLHQLLSSSAPRDLKPS